MSVLIFLSSSGRGGRELNTIRLIPYLRNRGMVVTVVVLDGGGYVTKRCHCLGVECYPLGLWPSKLNLMAVLMRFFLILRRLRPDLVQVYGFVASMIARFLTRPLRIKVVVGIVGAGHFISIRPILERLTKRLVDYYITNSLEGKEKLLEILGKYQPGVTVIHNGIPKYNLPPAEINIKSITVGTVANLRPEKGYDIMLKALAQVKAELGEEVSLKYLIAGEGGLKKELLENINSLGLAGQVFLLGMVDNVEEVLLRLELFVLPSYTEGLPNALLEAMAAGRCVIATKVGGITEIVKNGHSGMLVEPGNPEELAGAMLKVIRDPQWREAMALRGMEVVHNKFSLTRQAEETIRVWTSVCRKSLQQKTVG